METSQNSTEEKITIGSFKPSGYQSATWPIINSSDKHDTFTPLAFELVSRAEDATDPLFETFEVSAQTVRGKSAFEDKKVLFDEGEGAPGQVAEELTVIEPIELNAHTIQEVEIIVAERMAQEAEKHAIAVAQAREEGISQGRESAEGQVEEVKKQLSTRFEELCEDMRAQLAEASRTCEQQAVDLAFHVAQKLLGGVVEMDRSYIQEVVAQALKAAGGAEIHGVRVSPQDYEFLLACRSTSIPEDVNSEKWRLESDESIRAGCIITTSAGEVDFDLDKSWARMREKVLKGPKV